jgi:hypothetical protein
VSFIELRVYREGDERAINEAFNRVFHQRRTLEEWAWKFPPWPQPRAVLVAVVDDEVVAHNAGIPARVGLGGRTVGALQCVDTFSVADRLRRREWRGLWKEMMDRFAEEFGGNGVELLYGFPGPRARAQAVNRCGYDTIEPQPVTRLERVSPRSSLRRRLYRAEPARDWEPRLDLLWRRVSHRYPAAVVRDADQALYRLSGRPGVRYHRFVLLPRGSRTPVAFVAFRTGDRICRWVDLVWDAEHPGALDLAAHISAALAAAEGGHEELWLDGDQAAHERLERAGFRSELDPSGVAVVYRALTEDASRELRAAGGLYITMADADLV